MRLSLSALLISLLASPACAGVVFEIETRDHDYSPPRTERTSVLADGLSLKMESIDGQQRASDAMIYRGDRREMIVVDHERQSYMVIDQQFAANLVGQINNAAGQMKGMLDNLSPDQRAMAEQMMKQRGPQTRQLARPQLQVRNTGIQDQVYGYACVLFEVTLDGRKVRDVWVTNWNNINGGRELAGTFDSMSAFVLELTSALPRQAEGPVEDNVFATMKQLGGFPVATREYRADGSLESESALRSAQQQSINSAAFQPRSTYRQESLMPGSTPGSGPAFGSAAPSTAGQYRPGGR